MENNIILLNMFPNNTITNIVSKKYKTLGPIFLITFIYLLKNDFDLKRLKFFIKS